MQGLMVLADGVQAAQRSGGGISQLLIFGLLFVGMWFLFIAPQRKRQKRHQAMLSSLRVGSRVILSSGFFGKIVKVKDNNLSVEIAKNVRVDVLRGSVQQVIEGPVSGDDEEDEATQPELKAIEPKRERSKKTI
jgi:preprotein translocase subunit YajC